MREAPSVDSLLETVERVLTRMGIADVTPDSVIAAPRFYDGPVLIKDTDTLNGFIGRFALAARFVGYGFEDLAFLTVRQVCELYLRDSYPEAPSVPLSDAQYEARDDAQPRPTPAESDIPICFVLGCGRSGTTLFRTMLNLHEQLWAPGELHLASFEDMADRAANLSPVLRYMPIPELASRMREPIASFSSSFRSWELERRPISRVYESLHQADPRTLIVDKTPTYSGRLHDLERIGQQFPNARFLHLVRSPHDVVRSLVRMQLYKGARARFEPGLNPHHVAEATWFTHNSNSETMLRGIPAERSCTVRYEDLVTDAKTPLTRVCELLDLPYETAMADPYAKRSGRVALGAGDMEVNFLERVEKRAPSDAYYPVGARCESLASRYGY